MKYKKATIWISSTAILVLLAFWVLPATLHHDNPGIHASTAYQVKATMWSYLSDLQQDLWGLHITVDAQVGTQFMVTTYTVFGFPSEHYILRCVPYEQTTKITDDHVRIDCTDIERERVIH